MLYDGQGIIVIVYSGILSESLTSFQPDESPQSRREIPGIIGYCPNSLALEVAYNTTEHSSADRSSKQDVLTYQHNNLENRFFRLFIMMNIALHSLRRQPPRKMLMLMSRALSLSGIARTEIHTDLGVRQQLLAGVKTAMKNKDSSSSTTLRSILSEVYAADKSTGVPVSSSTIIAILRKATLRRHDSASQFIKASRPDLAQKERHEAVILSAFLPPLMSESDIDCILNEVIAETTLDGDPRKILGRVYKTFYSKVDKSHVDTETVKRKAEALLLNTS